jgi:hypothetical protein
MRGLVSRLLRVACEIGAPGFEPGTSCSQSGMTAPRLSSITRKSSAERQVLPHVETAVHRLSEKSPDKFPDSEGGVTHV